MDVDILADIEGDLRDNITEISTDEFYDTSAKKDMSQIHFAQKRLLVIPCCFNGGSIWAISFLLNLTKTTNFISIFVTDY